MSKALTSAKSAHTKQLARIEKLRAQLQAAEEKERAQSARIARLEAASKKRAESAARKAAEEQRKADRAAVQKQRWTKDVELKEARAYFRSIKPKAKAAKAAAAAEVGRLEREAAKLKSDYQRLAPAPKTSKTKQPVAA